MKKMNHKRLPTRPSEKDFPPLKHTWFTDDDDVDIFAYEAGDYHNGPKCKVCDYAECHHCHPEVYEDTSCGFQQAENAYYRKKMEVQDYNSKVDFYNEQIGK
jgi:hypothetical protein